MQKWKDCPTHISQACHISKRWNFCLNDFIKSLDSSLSGTKEKRDSKIFAYCQIAYILWPFSMWDLLEPLSLCYYSNHDVMKLSTEVQPATFCNLSWLLLKPTNITSYRIGKNGFSSCSRSCISRAVNPSIHSQRYCQQFRHFKYVLFIYLFVSCFAPFSRICNSSKVAGRQHEFDP